MKKAIMEAYSISPTKVYTAQEFIEAKAKGELNNFKDVIFIPSPKDGNDTFIVIFNEATNGETTKSKSGKAFFRRRT